MRNLNAFDENYVSIRSFILISHSSIKLYTVPTPCEHMWAMVCLPLLLHVLMLPVSLLLHVLMLPVSLLLHVLMLPVAPCTDVTCLLVAPCAHVAGVLVASCADGVFFSLLFISANNSPCCSVCCL